MKRDAKLAVWFVVLLVVLGGLGADQARAASHREAPLITEDPVADNTDVYAFVSPDNPDTVTIIANYIPLEEPGGGPNYYKFSDDVLYEIMIDTNGDAQEDITYQFTFQTTIASGDTFLYNLSPISPPLATDPAVQYPGSNVQQSFTLTQVRGDRRSGERTVLVPSARVAPVNIGPVSTPSYGSLAAAAVHFLPGGGKVFAGPRDDGFYIDLGAAFDLLGGFTSPSRAPVDTLSGFNVHTLALQIAKSRFAEAGDTDGIIGVWASASRPKIRILRGEGKAPLQQGPWVQVSRLGMPLVNELLIPLTDKDLYNASEPKDDAQNIADFIVNSGQQSGGLASLLASLTGCTPLSGRFDLEQLFLTGIPFIKLVFPGNMDTQQPDGPVLADMLRLNYNIPPSTSPNPLGLLGGDPAGFPNGRRLEDDVVDIELQAVAGVLLSIDPAGCNTGFAPQDLTDGVSSNDVPYLSNFPYLGTPHQGYSHEHTHGICSILCTLP